MNQDPQPLYVIRLFGDGTAPLRADRLEAKDDGEAIACVRERMRASRTFTRAALFRDQDLIADMSGPGFTATR